MLFKKIYLDKENFSFLISGLTHQKMAAVQRYQRLLAAVVVARLI